MPTSEECVASKLQRQSAYIADKPSATSLLLGGRNAYKYVSVCMLYIVQVFLEVYMRFIMCDEGRQREMYRRSNICLRRVHNTVQYGWTHTICYAYMTDMCAQCAQRLRRWISSGLLDSNYKLCSMNASTFHCVGKPVMVNTSTPKCTRLITDYHSTHTFYSVDVAIKTHTRRR